MWAASWEVMGPVMLCGLSASAAAMACCFCHCLGYGLTHCDLLTCHLFSFCVCLTETFLLLTPCNELCLNDDNA